MVKALLCIIVVLSSTYIGFNYSTALYRRKSVLESFELELRNCSTKIRYNSFELSKVFENSFMGYSFDDKRPFSEQWCEMLVSYSKILSEEDIGILTDFSKNVGTYDITGEISNIDMYIELIKAQINEADLNIKSKSKLYKTLGVSFGLAIAILLI